MKIRIIANPLKEWAKEISDKLRKILRAAGYSVVNGKADITICVGGDGTILYAGYKGWLSGKILGIGSKRSYICQLHKSNWEKKLFEVLDGETDDVFTLEYEIRGKNSKIVSGRAINDIVIHSNDYRVLGITAFINNKKNYFYSDGVIVSSAIGSTGYAYSAGGKRLKHTSRLMQFVPIAPYRRKFSPITLRPTDRLKIKADRTCAFILDGIYIKELKPNETVIIKQGRALKFFKGVGWYEER